MARNWDNINRANRAYRLRLKSSPEPALARSHSVEKIIPPRSLVVLDSRGQPISLPKVSILERDKA